MAARQPSVRGVSDEHTVTSPLQGTVVTVRASVGEAVAEGMTVVVLESMKMEQEVVAPGSGTVTEIVVAPGDAVERGQVLAVLRAGPSPSSPPSPSSRSGIATASEGPEPAAPRPPATSSPAAPPGPDGERASLRELRRRRELLSDEARPDAVERRRARGQRTARENIADLCDEGSFQEYGGLVVAAQRARRSREELESRTPADGLVTGIGRVNAALFGDHRSSCAVLAYDFTVLAGTQGQMNHRKKDRILELAERLRLPVVLFAEGGGGRPGDTDTAVVTGLDTTAFAAFGRLSGLVPTVGIVAGRCFAGNAALLGCCDVIIATADANIGMGGPAMISGGGLGSFRPEEIGPQAVQLANGVVDVGVFDEAEAVSLARRYLSYFQGAVDSWDCVDQARLQTVLPEDRRRGYDVRPVIELLADTGSVLELRPGFAPNLVTCLIRLEGRPLGLVANNPAHLAGAIDAAAADKAARFMQLCQAHSLPLVSLCDTPGFLVGPKAEEAALVRHAARLFVAGSSMTVPLFAVVLRRGYGLGAQAMAGGSFRAPVFTLSWDTGELGGMGLEGAVELGFRRELEAVADPVERRDLFNRLVAAAYQSGGAVNVATHFELDDVIEPHETRRRLVHGLRSVPARPPGRGTTERHRPVDPW